MDVWNSFRSSGWWTLSLFSLAVSTFGQGPGSVVSHAKISASAGGFTGVLGEDDSFGFALESLGDWDGNGVPELAVSATGDDDGGSSRGAVWILFLDTDGSVSSHQKISDTAGGFTGTLDDFDSFGSSLASLSDFDGDGVTDLAVGMGSDDDGGVNTGAVWILFLDADGTVDTHQKISPISGGFTGSLDDSDGFGRSVATLGDLDGDGVTDIVVGASSDDDGIHNAGAVWVLFLNADGSVKSHQKISATEGGFGGTLSNSARFGSSLAPLGDLDGDGVLDVAVGASGRNPDGFNRGAIWILFLNADGTVKTEQEIREGVGGFTGLIDEGDELGISATVVGDLDGDGIPDLAVGAHRDDDGGSWVSDIGALWILFLRADGTVRAHQKISAEEGGFAGGIEPRDNFGVALAPLGDFDGNGAPDLAVGAFSDDDGGFDFGATWLVFLEGCFAEAELRNAGTNPVSYTATPPVLGGTFTGTVDLSTTGHALAVLLGYAGPLTFLLGGGQTVLVDVTDPAGELLALSPAGPVAVFRLTVPNDLSFCGFELSTQAVHIGGVVPFALSNAQDLRVGH